MTTEQLDYIAFRVVELLEERHKETPQHWVSQNTAQKMFGGRKYLEQLRVERKVATRLIANRREYYVKDLTKYLTPKAMILQTRKYNKKNKENG